jgi:hypothetical protein
MLLTVQVGAGHYVMRQAGEPLENQFAYVDALVAKVRDVPEAPRRAFATPTSMGYLLVVAGAMTLIGSRRGAWCNNCGVTTWCCPSWRNLETVRPRG